MRQRGHPRGGRRVLLVAVDLSEAREAVGAVYVHRARAADALAGSKSFFFFRGEDEVFEVDRLNQDEEEKSLSFLKTETARTGTTAGTRAWCPARP